VRIPAIGSAISLPPPHDYRRFRSLLGTGQEEPCPGCGRHAERIWFDGVLPAQPFCERCYIETGAEDHGDAACGTLARLDGAGIWRPTGQGGDIRVEPYDFDW
jgi:hypothetical protein